MLIVVMAVTENQPGEKITQKVCYAITSFIPDVKSFATGV